MPKNPSWSFNRCLCWPENPWVRCGRRRAVEWAVEDLTMIQSATKVAIPLIAVIRSVAGQAQSSLISRGKELTEQAHRKYRSRRLSEVPAVTAVAPKPGVRDMKVDVATNGRENRVVSLDTRRQSSSCRSAKNAAIIAAYPSGFAETRSPPRTRYAGSKWAINRETKEWKNLAPLEPCLTFPTVPSANRPATFAFGVPAGGSSAWRSLLISAGFAA
jgi:hypothetical protein